MLVIFVYFSVLLWNSKLVKPHHRWNVDPNRLKPVVMFCCWTKWSVVGGLLALCLSSWSHVCDSVSQRLSLLLLLHYSSPHLLVRHLFLQLAHYVKLKNEKVLFNFQLRLFCLVWPILKYHHTSNLTGLMSQCDKALNKWKFQFGGNYCAFYWVE